METESGQSRWTRRVREDDARRHLREVYGCLLLLNPAVAGRKVSQQIRTHGLPNENQADGVVYISNPEAAPYIERFLEVLRSTSEGQPISSEAMAMITSALKRPTEVEALEQPVLQRREGGGPFQTTIREGMCVIRTDTIRACAESLVAYLRLAPTAGRWLHVVCGLNECGNIVEGGRGNKHFCSDQCRTEFWNRKRSAEEYREQRRKNYEYKRSTAKKQSSKKRR